MPTDEATLGYLAGLLDGEGTITTQGSQSGWRVAIGMTDEPVIRWLASFGGGTVSTDHRKGRPEHKTLWRWRLLRQAEVYQFLVAVRPHMRVKHDRADEVIQAIAAMLPAYTL